MQERRKQPRKNLMSYSQVFDLYEGRLVGYLGDLNLLGAMVIGDQPIQVGANMTVSIQLPELPNVSATRMALPVRVAWCQPDLSPEYFNLGLEFTLITDEQKQIVEAVIENYEFRRESPNYPPRPEVG
jgi:Tfp pilus assembly protein PilZ